MNEAMAASTTKAMRSTQCATTPSLHALHNTPMKLLFVRVAKVALYQVSLMRTGRDGNGAASPSDRTLGSPGMGSGLRDLVLVGTQVQETSETVQV